MLGCYSKLQAACCTNRPYLVVLCCNTANRAQRHPSGSIFSYPPSGSLKDRNDCRWKISRQRFPHVNEDLRENRGVDTHPEKMIGRLLYNYKTLRYASFITARPAGGAVWPWLCVSSRKRWPIRLPNHRQRFLIIANKLQNILHGAKYQALDPDQH